MVFFFYFGFLNRNKMSSANQTKEQQKEETKLLFGNLSKKHLLFQCRDVCIIIQSYMLQFQLSFVTVTQVGDHLVPSSIKFIDNGSKLLIQDTVNSSCFIMESDSEGLFHYQKNFLRFDRTCYFHVVDFGFNHYVGVLRGEHQWFKVDRKMVETGEQNFEISKSATYADLYVEMSDVVINHKEKEVYVLESGDNVICIYDFDTMRIKRLKTIMYPGKYKSMSIDFKNGLLVVASNHDLLVCDLKTFDRKLRIDCPGARALCIDDNCIAVIKKINKKLKIVAFYDATTGFLLREVEFLNKHPSAIALHKSRLVVSDPLNKTLDSFECRFSALS